MPSSTSHKLPMALLLLLLGLSVLMQAATAKIICEDLPKDLCAFSVSAASKRCLLESYQENDGATEYKCQTSEVVADHMSDWIEADQCVMECGVDRNMVGISSDSFLEPQFTASLCSPACYQNCPNIVDLYFNLAAGEGTYLPDLCAARRVNPHRAMVELLSSGAASAPVAGDDLGKLAEPVAAATPEASPPAFS